MKSMVLMVTGLMAGLAASEARAACMDGATSGCSMGNSCPGQRECVDGDWGFCEPIAGTKSCTVCNGPGTQMCNDEGNIVSLCTRPEQCNNCDDDRDGQIDEGLQACGGVTCGHIFELCGDGLDNDCDGSTDEGCAQCDSITEHAFPYVFNSALEMRLDTQPTGTTQEYGRNMDSTWRFIGSHRMTSMSLTFDQFATEGNVDFFRINNTTFHGAKVLPFLTPSSPVSPGTTTTLGFQSSASTQNTGVRTTQIRAKCDNGGGNWFHSIGLNQGADGVLLHTDDNAYFQFTLPADREVFISLDHNFGPASDFDLFVTVGGVNTLFGTSCANSDVCGFSPSTTGEAVHIPSEHGIDRLVKVNVNAFSGAGRFRLFLASPVATAPWVPELAIEANAAAGSVADTRVRGAWGQAQRLMLAATEGQYRIRSNAKLSTGETCYSCFDVTFTELNAVNVLKPCVPAVAWETLLVRWVTVARPYWMGTATWVDNGTVCANPPANVERVGETLAHEWGHHEFLLIDEYDSNNGNQCGFSLMAANTNFSGGNNYLEFCTSEQHGTNPGPGVAPAGFASNWAGILVHYPNMQPPAGTADFSRMMRLGEMMRDGSFVTFNAL